MVCTLQNKMGLISGLVRFGVDCQQKIRQNFLHSMLAVIIFLFLYNSYILVCKKGSGVMAIYGQ